MPKTMTLNVRLSGPLGDFVAENVGESGLYENVSEYVRDLIRKDKERADQAQFARLQAELSAAFAVADDQFETLTASDIISRNRG